MCLPSHRSRPYSGRPCVSDFLLLERIGRHRIAIATGIVTHPCMQLDVHTLEATLLSSQDGYAFGDEILDAVAAGETLEVLFEDGTVRRWRNASHAANFLREYGWNSQTPAQEI